MKITVIKSVVSTPEGKRYKICELGYRTDDGKIKGMRIFGFGEQKNNFDVASKAVAGDIMEAQFKTNEKGFWEFASLENTGVKEAMTNASVNNQTTVTTPSRGNWETPEERAARQVMIVRQSSLSNAIAYLTAIGNKTFTEYDVIAVATTFETEYVLKKGDVYGDVE